MGVLRFSSVILAVGVAFIAAQSSGTTSAPPDFYKTLAQSWAEDNVFLDSVAVAHLNDSYPGFFLQLLFGIHGDHTLYSITNITAAQCLTGNAALVSHINSLRQFGNQTTQLNSNQCSTTLVGEPYYQCVFERLGQVWIQVFIVGNDPAVQNITTDSYLTVILNVFAVVTRVINIIDSPNPSGSACLAVLADGSKTFEALQETIN